MSTKPTRSESQLLQFAGSWRITAGTFPGSTNGSLNVSLVAGGRGLYSVYTHGAGDEQYEANVLWGYDSATDQIRAFELNSLGVAELHVGAFNQSGALLLELRKADSNELRERRVLRLSGDTLKMDAWFYADGQETKHSMTLVRT